MKCPRCGTESASDQKFCRSCGAAMSASASAATPNGAAAAPPSPAAAPPPPVAAAAPPPVAQPRPAPAAYGAPPAQGAYGAPPGMVPMVYQAYPGGPQQVYYVPAQGTHAHAGAGVMEGLGSKIRELCATDKLEGFSFKELFKEVFTKHGGDAVEEYLAVGTPRTTPPLELVDTNWPKPWIFFRVMAGLIACYLAYYAVVVFSQNTYPMPGLMVLGTFAMPMATLVLIWELNTPRNVSIIQTIYVLVVGGAISVLIITLWYLAPLFNNVPLPGIVEETSKLLAVVIVMYGARGARYPYQLNGILFGAAVGAGYSASETLGYGMQGYSQTLLNFIQNGGLNQLMQAHGGSVLISTIFLEPLKAMISELNLRGIESPLGHVVWTAIAGGAFWRVKGDRPVSISMFLDGRFLRAFCIPVLMHTTWDISLFFPNMNPYLALYGLPIGTGIISWYVLFTMIQQGLHQVRDMQKLQLEHTMAHVQATMQPVAAVGTYAVQARGPAGA